MNYQKAYDFTAEHIGFLVCCEGMSEDAARAEANKNRVASDLIDRAKWRKCKTEGHKIVDDGSYGNPESGADRLCCTRCGESWHHQYY